MMFKKLAPEKIDFISHLKQFPHCDPRILHAPGECKYCDERKDWQALRQAWQIAFTGWTPEETELPCPADYSRGNAHSRWYGNVACPEDK